jgi:hypothetical protein
MSGKKDKELKKLRKQVQQLTAVVNDMVSSQKRKEHPKKDKHKRHPSKKSKILSDIPVLGHGARERKPKVRYEEKRDRLEEITERLRASCGPQRLEEIRKEALEKKMMTKEQSEEYEKKEREKKLEAKRKYQKEYLKNNPGKRLPPPAGFKSWIEFHQSKQKKVE